VREANASTGVWVSLPALAIYGTPTTRQQIARGAAELSEAAPTVESNVDPVTSEPHLKKMAYYSAREEITRGVSTLAEVTPMFSAFSVSYRGCVSPMSAESMGSLGLSMADLGLLSAIAVEQSAVIHRIFGMSTMRARA